MFKRWSPKRRSFHLCLLLVALTASLFQLALRAGPMPGKGRAPRAEHGAERDDGDETLGGARVSEAGA
jgi:hypothetical protein